LRITALVLIVSSACLFGFPRGVHAWAEIEADGEPETLKKLEHSAHSLALGGYQSSNRRTAYVLHARCLRTLLTAPRAAPSAR
jgi:hypothetical protein